MSEFVRRSLLRRPAGFSEGRAGQDPKLRVVAVGGHADDPGSCAGGTLSLYADQGHDVVGLALAGGPPPPADADPQDLRVKNRRNAMRQAEILKYRLDCLSYKGSNSGQSQVPIVYREACEISGQRYKDFTEILMDKYNPDIVFTHWPIDFHMDHRAASLLTLEAWLRSGKRFALYYMEAELGDQTQNFFPTHYVDITAVEERTYQAWLADTEVYPTVWPLHNLMRQIRGREHGCKVAEAFNHHPQSPATPALPA